MNICPNKKNKLVMKEFNEVVELFGTDIAYFLWDKNGGYGLDRDQNGNLSNRFSNVKSEKERKALMKEIGNEIILSSYQQQEGLIDYVTADGGEETIKGLLGVDKSKLISLLGSTMYQANVLTTAVKELLQNAFDAVKIAKALGKVQDAKIDVVIDSKERTITISDNGIGMSPEIVLKAFFTIGGSYKGDNVDNKLKSGGLGLAKMAFLFSSDYIEVTTVKDGVKTYAKTNPEEILNDNFTITTSKTSEPNGTTVTVRIPEYYYTQEGDKKQIWFNTDPDFLNKPMIGDVTVNITRKGGWYSDDGKKESSYKGNIPEGYYHVGNATSDFGEVEIYVAPTSSSGSYVNSDILISGLYLFRDNIWLENQRSRVKVILNILPTVGVTDPIYPINNQREGFRNTVTPEIEDLQYLIKKINHALERKSISLAFNNTVSMNVKKVADVTREKPKENLIEDVVKDIRKLFSLNKESSSDNKPEDLKKAMVLVWKAIKEDKEKEKLEKSRRSSLNTSNIDIDDSISSVDTSGLDVSKPVFHNNTTMVLGEDAQKVLNEIGALLMELKSLYILTYEGQPIKTRHGKNIVDFIKTQYWGFSFDKNYGGVNVVPLVFNLLAINPFYKIPEMANVDIALALTEYITHLIIHEFNHNYASGEGAEFTGRFPLTYAEFAGIGKEFNKDWKNKLYKIIRDNINIFIQYEAEYKQSSALGESLREDRLLSSGEEETSQSQESGIEGDGKNGQRLGVKENVSGYGEELRPLFDAIRLEQELEKLSKPFMFLVGSLKHEHREENLQKLKEYYAELPTTIEYCKRAAVYAKQCEKIYKRMFSDLNSTDNEEQKRDAAQLYLNELTLVYKQGRAPYHNKPYKFEKNGRVFVVLPAKSELELLESFLQSLNDLSDDVIYSELMRIEQEESDDHMFYINPRKYPNIRELLHRKISFFSGNDIDEAVDFLHGLENNQENNAYVDCCLRWLKNGTILLPRDNDIVRKAFDFARIHRVDIQHCKSPLEIYQKYIESKQVRVETRPVVMSNYNKMIFNRTETVNGVQVDIYDVENSDEGRQQVCQLLADSNPKKANGVPIDYSPWCLSVFNVDANGKATPEEGARRMWNRYDSPKRLIAIANGRPVAFNSDYRNEAKIKKFHGLNVIFTPNRQYKGSLYEITPRNYAVNFTAIEEQTIRALLNLGKLVNIFEGHENEYFPVYSIPVEYVNEIEEYENDSWWDYHDVKHKSIQEVNVNLAEEVLRRKTTYTGYNARYFGNYLVNIDESNNDIGQISYKDDGIIIHLTTENTLPQYVDVEVGSYPGVIVRVSLEPNWFHMDIGHRPFGYNQTTIVSTYDKVVRAIENIVNREASTISTGLLAQVGISEEQRDRILDLSDKLSARLNDIKQQIPFDLRRVSPVANQLLAEITSALKIAEDYIRLNVLNEPIRGRRPSRTETFDPNGYDTEDDDVAVTFWRQVAEANENAWLQEQGLGYLIDLPETEIPAVTSFVMRDYMWDRYNELIEKPMNKELSNVLHEILRKFHFDIVEKDLTDIFGENVLGAFDYLQKIVYLAQEGDRNAITDAEEFAHAFIKMMGARYRRQESRDKFPENKLYSELRDLLDGTYFYANVYNEYKDVYKYSNGEPDIAKIKEEALGKALAVALNDAMNRYTDEKSKTFFQKLISWFDKAILWIKSRITKNNSQGLQDLNTELNKIADSILDGTYFKKYLKKIDDKKYRRVGYQESMKYAESIGRGDMIDLMRDMSDLGGIVSGSISYRLQGILKRPRLDTLHDIDIAFPLSAHGLHLRHPADPTRFPSMYYLGRDNVWAGDALMQEIEMNPQTHNILETLRRRPGFDIIGAFMSDTNVILNAIICEDPSIIERFKAMTGNFNDRLSKFTKEERNKITLIDLFFNGTNEVGSDYIRDTERGVNLANYRHSFDAKLKFGRAKDIYDYQLFEPEHRFYKLGVNDAAVSRAGMTTEDFMYLIGQQLLRASELSEKIAGQFNKLYQKYVKMPNKPASRLKILDKIYEKFNELSLAEDYEAVAIALQFAVESVGVWDKNANAPQGLNTLLSYLYQQKNLAEPYSGITPQILIDMYKNSISFYDDLISHFIPDVTDPNLSEQDRLNIDTVVSSIRTARQMWLEALVVVGDKIVDKNIDDWVHATTEDKENMKIVAKDYLHRNIMYGDTYSAYATFLNNGFSNSPIVKQAFHLILTAETQKLEEFLPIKDRVMRSFAKANSMMRKAKSGFGNWQTMLMEHDRDGVPTGNFIQRINYGQYQKDLSEFLKALNDEFKSRYGHFYVTDDNGVVTNSLTGERADREEWGPNGETPAYIEYQLAIDKWKCDHSNRRYTYKYYAERLSRPYRGSTDPNEATNPDGHGLSLDTLFIYDHIQSNINYYLDKCTDKKTGYPHPENLSPDEKKALDMWQNRLDDLQNPYNEDMSPKSDTAKRMAFEIRAWLKWLGQRTITTIDLEQYNAELDDAKDRALKENNPNIYWDFIKYNSRVGINPEYLNMVFGLQQAKDKSFIVLHAELIKRSLLSLVRTNTNEYTRDLTKYVNVPEFWASCRNVDQIIEDGRDLSSEEENEGGVPIEFDDYFEYHSILYRDPSGNYVDFLGHTIPAGSAAGRNDLLTFLEWIINYYTNQILASGSRTFPGVNDASGNPYVFTGSAEDVKDKVRMLFTYTKRYIDDEGNVVVKSEPLTIFKLLMPTTDKFINPRTGKEEPTILNVPNGRFANKSDAAKEYFNENFDHSDLNSEQPKAFDEHGNTMYFNEEFYKILKDGKLSLLYEDLIWAMQYAQDAYSSQNRRFNYALPAIEADLMLILTRIKKLGAAHMYLAAKEQLTSVRWNDQDMRRRNQYIRDFDGTIADDVPLRFIGTLEDPSQYTTDVVGAVMEFVDMALGFKYKSRIDAQLKTLQYNMDDSFRAQMKENGEDFKYANNPNYSKLMLAMLNMHMYNNQWAEDPTEAPSSPNLVFRNKVFRRIQSMERLHMLNFNLLSMVTGGGDAVSRVLKESINSKYFTLRDMLRSLVSVLRYTPQCILNISNPLANNKLTRAMQLNGVSKDTHAIYEHTNRIRPLKLLSNIAMQGFSLIDWMVNALLLRCQYNNYRLYNGGVVPTGFYSLYELLRAFVDAGKSKYAAIKAHMFSPTTLWHAYDNNMLLKPEFSKEFDEHGNRNPDFICHVSLNTKTEVRGRTFQRGGLINGMNPDNDKPSSKFTNIGNAITALRGWMFLVYQHLIIGREENVPREFIEETSYDTKKRHGKTVSKTTVKEKPMSTDLRNSRMSWNYETGTPNDAIYRNIVSSFKTLYNKLIRAALLRNSKYKGTKLSYPEKYAWRSAIVYLAILGAQMLYWPTINEMAKSVRPPSNREQAGPVSVTDVPRWFKEQYLGEKYYLLQASDIGFRVIESLITSIDPTSALGTVKQVSTLFSGVDEHMNLFKAAGDITGFSGHQLSEELGPGSYNYYTRGERVGYKMFGSLDNLHTSFTYNGLKYNQQWYTNTYGGIYRWFGYDFSWGSDKGGMNLDLDLDLNLDMNLDLDLDL